MIAKVAARSSKYRGKRSAIHQRLQRGQSLVEFALSLSVLVLAFSGAIDLGRAFFTRITMQTAISEGAHWTAAYPGCFLYGAAFGDLSNVVNAPVYCQGTNAISQRIRYESTLLLPAMVQSTYLNTPGSIPAYQVKPGQTITIGMTYQMPLLTPVMRGIFGDTLTLTVEDKEVIRGTTLPSSTGKPGTYTQVLNPPMVTNLSQLASDGTTACDHGYAPVSWKQPAPGGSPVSTPASFEVWIVDAGSATLINANSSATGYLDSVGAASTGTQFYSLKTGTTTPSVPSTYQISRTTGGGIMYGVRTKDTAGNYSDFEYIFLTCTMVEPTAFSNSCVTGTPYSTGVTFTWSMPTTAYSWSSFTQDIDKEVSGYKVIRTIDNTVQASATGRTATSVTLNFTNPTTLTDLNRGYTYYIVAVDGSGNPVGLDNSGNTLTISGSTASGHTKTSNDLTITCN